MSPPHNPDEAEQLMLLRSDLSMQGKSISELTLDQRGTKDRVAALERARDISDVEDKHLDERLDRIEARIHRVYKLGWWILGAFGAVAVGLIANFAFRGGFYVP